MLGNGKLFVKIFQNQEITTEDDLTAGNTETDRMRELQDKVACLRAQVSKMVMVVMVMVVVSCFHGVFLALHMTVYSVG